MKQLLITIAALVLVGCGGGTPNISIQLAAEAGFIQEIKQHIAAGTDVNVKNYYNYTPLHGATFNGHKEIAELLIANGADVNARDNGGKTPLDETMTDLSLNKKELADLLRKHGGKTRAELKAEGK